MKILLVFFAVFSFFLPKLEKEKRRASGNNSLERLLAEGPQELGSDTSRQTSPAK